MQTVTPSLTFKDGAEDALKLYVSVIRNSKIVNIMRSEGGPIAKGKVLHATFELDGREFTAMDGGPSFSFTEGFSLVATCETQQELDEIWRRLSEDGGEEGPCGWLKDRFGVSWQVLPRALGEMMGDPRSGNPGKVMEALLKMGKIDIAALEQAYRQR
ncbi:MAG: VOC family protein [Chloroflexi bacterium]|nr:MAG: VOC family protein [Chloroflexota bacterium]